jgi:hypothetical protein
LGYTVKGKIPYSDKRKKENAMYWIKSKEDKYVVKYSPKSSYL